MTSGHCVYEGTVDGLLPFLSGRNLRCPQYHNPADYGDLLVRLMKNFSKYGIINKPNVFI